MLTLPAVFTGLSILAAPASIEEVPNPRQQHGGWVSDMANLIEPEAEAALEARLTELEQQTGVELTVVTVYEADLTPKEFSTRLFNHWGVGKAGLNNGLMMLLVLDLRRLEVEVGTGLSATLDNDWLGQMQRDVMVPRFKEGRFDLGIDAGVDQLIGKLAGKAQDDPVLEEMAKAHQRELAAHEAPVQDSGSNWAAIGVAGSTALGALGLAVWTWRRRRRALTHCEACGVQRVELARPEVLKRLKDGQRKEMELESVDYRVFACPSCDDCREEGSENTMSQYLRCPKCNFVTATLESTVLEEATEFSEGRKRETYSCRHCGCTTTHEVDTPQLHNYDNYDNYDESDGFISSATDFGSSDIGSSDFGGGFSDGGGAGSDW